MLAEGLQAIHGVRPSPSKMRLIPTPSMQGTASCSFYPIGLQRKTRVVLLYQRPKVTDVRDHLRCGREMRKVLLSGNDHRAMLREDTLESSIETELPHGI